MGIDGRTLGGSRARNKACLRPRSVLLDVSRQRPAPQVPGQLGNALMSALGIHNVTSEEKCCSKKVTSRLRVSRGKQIRLSPLRMRRKWEAPAYAQSEPFSGPADKSGHFSLAISREILALRPHTLQLQGRLPGAVVRET